MTPEQWQIVNQLFLEAIDLPAQEWPAFLEDRASASPAIRAEVAALLESHENSQTFLSRPALAAESQKSLRPDPLEEGSRLGSFVIQKTLGVGGFAHVYLALDTQFDRQVALKVSRSMGQEAQTMAPLHHSGIVRVYGQTEFADAGLKAISMQLICGATLEDVWRHIVPGSTDSRQFFQSLDEQHVGDAPFDYTQATQRETWSQRSLASYVLHLAKEIVEALEHAHAQNILHLDLKPSNVLIDQYGRPHLTDFNVSLNQNTSSSDSLLGGTDRYMSPEQKTFLSAPQDSPKLTGASDVYSLGLMLEELLQDVSMPERLQDLIAPLMAQCLEKDSQVRPTCTEIKNRCTAAIDAAVQMESSTPVSRQHHYLVSLFAIALIPQLLSSIVNVAYNTLKIGPSLSATQQEAFAAAIFPYNAITYPIGVAICMPLVFRLRGWIAHKGTASSQQLYSITKVIVIATTVGWLPGALVFPKYIESTAGALTGEIYLHFATSFTLSWIIATVYSVLGIDWYVSKVLIPGIGKLPCRISRDLSQQVTGRLTLIKVCAALIPLISAILLIFQTPIDSPASDYSSFQIFQLIVVGLLAASLAGFMLILRLGSAIEKRITWSVGSAS